MMMRMRAKGLHMLNESYNISKDGAIKKGKKG
jgi:hypothetical protein